MEELFGAFERRPRDTGRRDVVRNVHRRTQELVLWRDVARLSEAEEKIASRLVDAKPPSLLCPQGFPESTREQRGVILFHGTGTGKTATSLTVALALAVAKGGRERAGDAGVAFFTYKNLVEQVRRDARAHIVVAAEMLDSGRLEVLSYEEAATKKRFRSAGWAERRVLIVDEAHYHLRADPKEQVQDRKYNAHLQQLCRRAWRVLLLTATPTTTSPADFARMLAVLQASGAEERLVDAALQEENFTRWWQDVQPLVAEVYEECPPPLSKGDASCGALRRLFAADAPRSPGTSCADRYDALLRRAALRGVLPLIMGRVSYLPKVESSAEYPTAWRFALRLRVEAGEVQRGMVVPIEGGARRDPVAAAPATQLRERGQGRGADEDERSRDGAKQERHEKERAMLFQKLRVLKPFFSEDFEAVLACLASLEAVTFPTACAAALRNSDLPQLQQHGAGFPEPSVRRTVVYVADINKGPALRLEAALKEDFGDPAVAVRRLSAELGDKARADAIADYNAGRVRVLLIGKGAAQGLDLKGTTSVLFFDTPKSKAIVEQVEGRGVRKASHADVGWKHVLVVQLFGPAEELRKEESDANVDCVKLLAQLCSLEALESLT